MSDTILYLVRHGESIGNSLRTLLGHTDLGLSELGIEQAQKCASALSSVPFGAIYSSDLKRAMDTAAPHGKVHSLPVIPRAGLRELHIGLWENMHIDDIKERFCDLYFHNWREDFFEFQAPGGESVPHLKERITAELSCIANNHPGQNVLVVFHAAAIRAFWSGIYEFQENDKCTELPFPKNASYSTVKYSDGKFTPISFSVCDYIE